MKGYTARTADRTADKKTVILPFEFTCSPLKKLALINFENDPDNKYIALEPQYISGDQTGQGFRVIAYRNDGYVDVYDDFSLQDENDGRFDVTGRGLNERKKVKISNTCFKETRNGLILSFEFKDKYERKISLKISEQTEKKTRGVNLLAPVGSTTINPSYLPLFFLYKFDFIRRSKTDVKLTIDGRPHELDSFPYPVPKDFQRRYFTRYSHDCQIIEFAHAGQKILVEHEIINGSMSTNNKEILVSPAGELKKMQHKKGDHNFSIKFRPAFPDIRNLAEGKRYNGVLKIYSDPVMGSLSGDYWIGREKNTVKLKMNINEGWSPVTDSIFTKLMFGKKSVFCSWPKSYYYKQEIDLTSLESSSSWENKNII